MRRASEPVKAVLLAAVLLAAYGLAHELATILVLLVMTLIIVLPVSACATWMERRGVPRIAGALAGLALLLGSVGGTVALVMPTFVDQANAFVERVPAMVDELRGAASDVTGERPSDIGRDVSDYLQRYIDQPQRLLGPVASIGLGIAGVAAAFVLVLMTAFYVAANPRPLVDGFVALFPVRRQPDVRRVLADLGAAWWGWLRGVAADMLITGALLYAGLMLVGLDFALVFAVISALFVVVPNLGSIAGGLPPVLFALTDSPTTALLVLAVYIAVQQIEGNLIVPLIMARAVSLHPALIVIGVVVVGQLLGFVGLLVAVPLISATVILVRELWVEPLRRGDRRREVPEADSSGTAPRTVTTTLPNGA
jgi:predicted PurR-regulated permease PerM